MKRAPRIYLVLDCDHECQHCRDKCRGFRPVINGVKWHSLLVGAGYRKVVLTGGEPTLHHDFVQIFNGLPMEVVVESNLSRVGEIHKSLKRTATWIPSYHGHMPIRLFWEKIKLLEAAKQNVAPVVMVESISKLADYLSEFKRMCVECEVVPNEMNNKANGRSNEKGTIECQNNVLLYGPDGVRYSCTGKMFIRDQSGVIPGAKVQAVVKCSTPGLCRPYDRLRNRVGSEMVQTRKSSQPESVEIFPVKHEENPVAVNYKIPDTVDKTFCVLCTVYNRRMDGLVEDLKKQRDNCSLLTMRVFDDSTSKEDVSNDNYALYVENKKWIEVFNSRNNHGKRNFWQIHAFIHAYEQWINREYDYYVFLQDDLRLSERFVQAVDYFWQMAKNHDPNMVAMHLFRDSRSGKVIWTSVNPKNINVDGHRYNRVGWVDCVFVACREYFDALKNHIEAVAPTRWDKKPWLSSGVGQQISERLRRAGKTIYIPPVSLVHVADHVSVMQPDARAMFPMVEINFLDEVVPKKVPVYCGVATIPERVAMLDRLLDKIYDQVDHMQIYFNGHGEIPSCIRGRKITAAMSDEFGDRGDVGKFFWAGENKGYQLTCDDDMVPRSDAVARMIAKVEQYERKAAISIHGSLLKRHPIRSYYKDRLVLQDVDGDIYVALIGTGFMMWHTDALTVDQSVFKNINMSDIYFSMHATEHGIPLVVVRRSNILMRSDLISPCSIHLRFRNNDHVQTELVNEYTGWRNVRCGGA